MKKIHSENNDQESNNELPLLWKKVQVISQCLASLVIPILIGVAGYTINSSLSKAELNLKYISLALDILKKGDTSEKPKLNEWAVNIIEFYADQKIKIDPSTRRELLGYYTLGAIIVDKPATRTDFDIFICEKNRTVQEEAANKLIKLFKAWEKGFGQIRYAIWDESSEYSFEKLNDKATIIVDKGHDENGELEAIKGFVKTINNDLKIEVIDNISKPTPWRISIVLCPSK